MCIYYVVTDISEKPDMPALTEEQDKEADRGYAFAYEF
jgi:hypothetical protein